MQAGKRSGEAHLPIAAASQHVAQHVYSPHNCVPRSTNAGCHPCSSKPVWTHWHTAKFPPEQTCSMQAGTPQSQAHSQRRRVTETKCSTTRMQQLLRRQFAGCAAGNVTGALSRIDGAMPSEAAAVAQIPVGNSCHCLQHWWGLA